MIDTTRQWAIAPEKHRQILHMLRSGVSIRATARTVGVGIRTVQRRCELLHQELDKEIAREVGKPAVEFRRVICQRCPVHGLVTTWPCVACEALAAKRFASVN